MLFAIESEGLVREAIGQVNFVFVPQHQVVKKVRTSGCKAEPFEQFAVRVEMHEFRPGALVAAGIRPDVAIPSVRFYSADWSEVISLGRKLCRLAFPDPEDLPFTQ